MSSGGRWTGEGTFSAVMRALFIGQSLRIRWKNRNPLLRKGSLPSTLLQPRQTMPHFTRRLEPGSCPEGPGDSGTGWGVGGRRRRLLLRSEVARWLSRGRTAGSGCQFQDWGCHCPRDRRGQMLSWGLESGWGRGTGICMGN